MTIGSTYDFHEVAAIFPLMDGEEFRAFKEDIAAHGLREPVWLHGGKIIDGRNRYRACLELGIEPDFREWDGDGSLVEFVVSLNLHRRHLTTSQRAACGVEIKRRFAAEAKDRQRAAGKANGGDRRSEQARADRLVEKMPQADLPTPRPAPKAREQAARAVGVAARSIQNAEKVAEKNPGLHERVKNGEVTLAQARRQIAREERRAELQARAVVAPQSDLWQVIEGDCVEVMDSLPAGSARLVFADPPYNIGKDYGAGAAADRLPDPEYLNWCADWIGRCYSLLTADGSLWVLINHEYAALMELILRGCFRIEFKAGGFLEQLVEGACGGTALSVVMGVERFYVRSWVTWHESFGINCAKGFNRCSRRLFHCVKDPHRFVFNADAVTRPSDRQTKYGDRRADPAGKLWDDVWGINPAIPRLTGTCAERVPDFPTQLPLALLRPIVGCASDPGDLIVDPFSGSGTTGAAALGLGRRYTGIEKSPKFADLSRLRLRAAEGSQE